MTREDILIQIEQCGVIPVIRGSSFEEALALVHAIEAGGITVFEITMTVPNALDVLKELERADSSGLIGAGTVLDAETARACISAGARFVVSPAFDAATVELCHRYGVPCFPGALTPTEVVRAWQSGASAVKIFPCSAMGGARYIQSLKAPLPQVRMIPTGGISVASAHEFLNAGAFALGVGADLADVHAARRGDHDKITEVARQYRAAVENHRAAKR
ncbi:4-Hydroxy-2-oxoglutarate aldolase [Acidisarcina polymorpha]|uniref:4-Hydroxy-2-oxoglutarate aldolase n=1 Tax=Acidisarcina polymorpha TaxID=2211140 RepID=A0A2Z5G7H1_9BACT|nr:bifunctional 4-hydroxy-2-oxoglutarate aldolase/2-dehydro-3-deoxy-phosphogluconate aldolase [Acidisarcina polymorpha]AXC14654.1 4-Hydroxy-2-oxoglutarate aldolase [Acidisarcina polymorpha]